MNISQNRIFVFGSNLSGIHGAGAARVAMDQYGAIYGNGQGPQGLTYALPTKGFNITDMSLKDIEVHVKYFLMYARSNPDVTFVVTQVGCGLAGHPVSSIASFFKDAPPNCEFDSAWSRHLPDDFSFWGTF